LALAFRIQLVRADGTIYIRSDGSIDPPTAPIQRDGDIFIFTDNIINDSIWVERSNIIIDGNGYSLQSMTGQYYMSDFRLVGIKNVTLNNTSINGFPGGIYFRDSSNNSITRSNITNSSLGIELYNSSYNSIIGNNIANYGNVYGIVLSDSSYYNNISGNNIKNNYYGIWLYASSNNRF
jgi:parallel beta-helix repeat protein